MSAQALVCPRCRNGVLSDAGGVAGAGRVDRLWMFAMFLYLALDGAGGEYRPGEISGCVSTQAGRAEELPGRANHSANARKVKTRCRPLRGEPALILQDLRARDRQVTVLNQPPFDGSNLS
jgi:hypothetical protein